MVPVLSAQITLAEPRDSTDSKFLTSIPLAYMSFATIERDTVIIASIPKGILAIIKPMAH